MGLLSKMFLNKAPTKIYLFFVCFSKLFIKLYIFLVKTGSFA